MASLAFLVSFRASGPLMGVFGFASKSVAALALAKLYDALPIVVTVLLGIRLGGLGPESLYLRKGEAPDSMPDESRGM